MCDDGSHDDDGVPQDLPAWRQGIKEEPWPEPAEPFRGVFDLDYLADNGRDPATGRTWHPLGPIHVRCPLPNGSYELRPQIAHRLAWWLGGMRDGAGLLQSELAQKLGTTQAAVSKWETGRTLITLDNLARVSDATGFPVALYFDYGGNERRRAMWL
jgi:hypothetical protein